MIYLHNLNSRSFIRFLIQFRSREENFDPICSHITKGECGKARRAASFTTHLTSGNNEPPPTTICDRVHFRPLIRPHTDVTLGHCSYLNTCYSEPTYAQSPSIPPFPGTSHSHGMAPPNSRGPTSLPSGLGAGGRGKEKQPCRYLHYEVDWDGGDGEWTKEKRPKKKIHRLSIGMGPVGHETKPVRCDTHCFLLRRRLTCIFFMVASSTMDQLRSPYL